MRLQDQAQACARVSVASEKASGELSDLLGKWFAKHFVKGVTLHALRAMHSGGALESFLECLAARDDAEVIAILRKLDPHRGELLKRSRLALDAHIRELAIGGIEPALDVKGLAKGITLPKLRALHEAGVLRTFLADLDPADIGATLRKLDPHYREIFDRTQPEMVAHIRELATGRMPAQKPKPAKKVKAPKGSPAKSARTGGVYERSRL